MARKKKPVKLLTLDTETDGLAGAIRRIAVYDGQQVTYGYTFDDVEPVLLEYSKEYDVHCYIHNLDFDARKIPKLFEKGNIKWNTCLVINRRYATITGVNYTIHDSFQMLPMGLDKASKEFNLEHGKMNLWEAVQKAYPNQYSDKVDFFSRCDVDDKIYLDYLGYDVISLYELIEKLIEVSTIPLEKIIKCPTTASMSKYILKNGYNGIPFKYEDRQYTDYEFLTKNKYWLSDKPMKNNPSVTWQELEYKIREGYFGGRTEVFIPHLLPDAGRVTGFYYDFNSLYPSVCKGKPYPIGVPEYINNVNSIRYKWRFWIRSKIGLGFVKCKVFVPKQDIPPLPVRLEKLCFPTGYISGTWTFNELEFAINNCGVKIIEFQEMIYFPQTYNVYDNFMSVFFDMKEYASKTGNKALRAFTKLLMNCAYGWTAMKRLQIKLDDISKAESYRQKDKLLNVNEDLGYCEAETIARSETIQVQIGAYVTSYARLALLEVLLMQNKIGKVYYTDTDSIICDTELDAEYVHNDEIGKLKVEHYLLEGLFLQPKVYSIRTTEELQNKFKGVTKKRKNTFDFNFYMDIYKMLCNKQKGQLIIEDNIERLPSLITAQKRGINPNTLTITHKSLNLENVQKRNMDYKNNKSVAWHMYNEEYFNNFSFIDDFNIRGEFFEKRR